VETVKRLLSSCYRHAYSSVGLRRTGHHLAQIPLVGPLIRKTSRAVTAIRSQRSWMETPYGWMLVDDYWERHYLARGNPEPDVSPTLQSLLRKGVCFYDIGAHLGFYGLMASRMACHPVFAFEPDPENAAVCRQIFVRNSALVEVIEAAVCDSDGSVTFARSGGINIGGKICDDGPLHVPCVTLDAFVRSHPAPDVIKIDVEGAELQVLEGAAYLLRDRRPTLMVEVHDETFEPRIGEMLKPLGYRIDVLSPGRGGHVLATFRP